MLTPDLPTPQGLAVTAPSPHGLCQAMCPGVTWGAERPKEFPSPSCLRCAASWKTRQIWGEGGGRAPATGKAGEIYQRIRRTHSPKFSCVSGRTADHGPRRAVSLSQKSFQQVQNGLGGWW